MKNKEKVQSLIQSSVDLLMKSQRYNDEYMFNALSISLHGEKRRTRLLSLEEHQLVSHLICKSYDNHKINIKKNYSTKEYPFINDYSKYFDTCLNRTEEEAETIHQIANDLVVSCATDLAAPLYDYYKCLMWHIADYRRKIDEYDRTGWDMSYILYYETTNCNTHDYLESKEKELGFKY